MIKSINLYLKQQIITIKRPEKNHKTTVFIPMNLYCIVYILGSFIFSSLSLLFPDLFILNSLEGTTPQQFPTSSCLAGDVHGKENLLSSSALVWGSDERILWN